MLSKLNKLRELSELGKMSEAQVAMWRRCRWRRDVWVCVWVLI